MERDSSGTVSVILIAVFAVMGVYWLSSSDIDMPEFLINTLIVIFAIVATFATLYFIYEGLLGLKSPSQWKVMLKGKIREIENLNASINDCISETEEIVRKSVTPHKNSLFEKLALLRKLSRALNRRISKCYQLQARGDRVSLLEAFDVVEMALDLDESAYDSVIDSKSQPPIEANAIFDRAFKLIEEIRAETFSDSSRIETISR